MTRRHVNMCEMGSGAHVHRHTISIRSYSGRRHHGGHSDGFRTTVPKLPAWKGGQLSTCAGDDIRGAHIVRVCLSKALAVETEKLLRLLIAQNKNFDARLERARRRAKANF